MPVTVKKIGGRYRIVDGGGTITKNRAGTSVDGGGKRSKSQAARQARAINASLSRAGRI